MWIRVNLKQIFVFNFHKFIRMVFYRIIIWWRSKVVTFCVNVLFETLKSYYNWLYYILNYSIYIIQYVKVYIVMIIFWVRYICITFFFLINHLTKIYLIYWFPFYLHKPYSTEYILVNTNCIKFKKKCIVIVVNVRVFILIFVYLEISLIINTIVTMLKHARWEIYSIYNQ